MKMNDGQRKVYSTLDAYIAGYLTLKKHTPEFENQNGKIVFVFPFTSELTKDIENYNDGAMVEALKFVCSIKALKTQIFSLKRSNDYEQRENFKQP